MPFPKAFAIKRPLTSLLTCGGQVANTLNWSKNATLLAVKIGMDDVELALTSPTHPNHSQVTSMPMGNAKTQLEALLNHNNNDIQGMVVGWPRQDDGRLGYQCGKVLHLLDSVQVSCKPAVCLYDPKELHVEEDDVWGRNPVYGRITEHKTLHIASREQYALNTLNAIPVVRATDLAEQFCQQYLSKHSHATADTMWRSTSSLDDLTSTTTTATSMNDWIPGEHQGQRSLASA